MLARGTERFQFYLEVVDVRLAQDEFGEGAQWICEVECQFSSRLKGQSPENET